MWRSFFLALGIMAVIVGAESLFIDHATMYGAADTQPASFLNPSGAPSTSSRTWTPGEAFPWVVLSIGAVVILYAFTLPQRFRRAA